MPRVFSTKVRNAGQLINEIKRFRKKRSFTQSQLGESAGIPQTSVSKIEVGMVDPTLTTLFRLLAALDLELEIHPRKKQTEKWLSDGAE